jgi:hypothetical protein
VCYRRYASEPYRNCGYDRGFALPFGDATPTARLKTGAGQFKRLATPWARRVLRTTDQGIIAHTPIRSDEPQLRPNFFGYKKNFLVCLGVLSFAA